MKYLIATLLVLMFSGTVQADTVAKISSILLYEDGNLIYVYPEGGVQNRPACHGSNGDYMSFRMDRPMAKEYLSALMMAFAADKTVAFRTRGACIDQPYSDTISYITVYK